MTSLENRIATLTDAELEGFEWGITRLDREANVRFLNAAEAKFTGRDRTEMLGRNFFLDVAPCAAVKSFQGRFDEFVAAPELTSKTFGFIYPFWLGHKQVRITMVRRPGDADNIFLVTELQDSPPDGG